jgi:L-ascorbate metabolism protein UlaG (beta-lactamase superfamily)
MDPITRRNFLAISAGAAASLAFAACSSDDDDGAASPTSGATEAASPTASAAVTPGADNGAISLRWFGQSMFLLTSPGGTRLLLDPFNDIGYTVPPPLNVDVATITHEHQDHNNGALAGTSAKVLPGLTSENWATIDETVGDIHISNIRSFHDDQRGAQRGRNSMFVVETAGLRIAHLGDLGHQLDDGQRAALANPDVLMVPVGGAFTIDASGATEVMNQLQPKIVFPMHYKTDRIAFNLATVDQFTTGKQVNLVGSTEMRIARDSMPDEATVFVLDYE